MCFGSNSSPPAAQTAPPPPPPLEDKPATPAFNESTTDATNASSAMDGARRGRKSLRVDLGVPSGSSTAAGGTGLGIPTG